jgi:hypothetical protein
MKRIYPIDTVLLALSLILQYSNSTTSEHILLISLYLAQRILKPTPLPQCILRRQLRLPALHIPLPAPTIRTLSGPKKSRRRRLLHSSDPVPARKHLSQPLRLVFVVGRSAPFPALEPEGPHFIGFAPRGYRRRGLRGRVSQKEVEGGFWLCCWVGVSGLQFDARWWWAWRREAQADGRGVGGRLGRLLGSFVRLLVWVGLGFGA